MKLLQCDAGDISKKKSITKISLKIFWIIKFKNYICL